MLVATSWVKSQSLSSNWYSTTVEGVDSLFLNFQDSTYYIYSELLIDYEGGGYEVDKFDFFQAHLRLKKEGYKAKLSDKQLVKEIDHTEYLLCQFTQDTLRFVAGKRFVDLGNGVLKEFPGKKVNQVFTLASY